MSALTNSAGPRNRLPANSRFDSLLTMLRPMLETMRLTNPVSPATAIAVVDTDTHPGQRSQSPTGRRNTTLISVSAGATIGGSAKAPPKRNRITVGEATDTLDPSWLFGKYPQVAAYYRMKRRYTLSKQALCV